MHRDIKPHNILCALPDEHVWEGSDDSTDEITSLKQLGGFVLKISDMGLSKQLEHEEGSFASMSMSCSAHMAEPIQQPLSGFSPGSQSQQSSSSSGSGAGRTIEASPVGTIGWQAPEVRVALCLLGCQ